VSDRQYGRLTGLYSGGLWMVPFRGIEGENSEKRGKFPWAGDLGPNRKVESKLLLLVQN
jgi:hypothetical protein